MSTKGIKIDPKKGSVGGFLIGDTISKVLTYIQINFQIYGKIDIVASKEDARQPIFIILSDSGFKLRFESRTQTLDQIEVYLQPGDFKKSLSFHLKDFSINTQTHIVTYSQISSLMGPTYPPRIMGSSVLLSYDTNLSFVFNYDEKVFKEGTGELKKDQEHFLAMNNRLVKMNISKESDSVNQSEKRVKDSVLILFGDHLMDVLRIVGNPNKEYYHEGSLFLNYLELGMDIMISPDHTVKKIVLHTNFPYHPHFCFHNRCNYELFIDQQPQLQVNNSIFNEEIKESYISQNDNSSSNFSSNNHSSKNSQKRKKQKSHQNGKDKSNLSVLSTKDSQQIQQNILDQKGAVITPFTKFSSIQDLLQDQSDDMFYVRNITNEFSTQYHAFKSIIFEVMNDTDYIASVTLFKVNQ